MTPSSPAAYQKPSVPYCPSNYKYSGEHTCRSWEIDAYISDVNDYIHSLEIYVNEAYSFANEANDYANQASSYAKCEADDAKSALE